MRSTITIKGMIVALVIFFIGVSSLFYFFLYQPKMSKARKGTRAISSLSANVERAIQDLKETREEIERIKREEVNVDYFKRQHIPSQERTPTFLKNIETLAGQLGFEYDGVKPMDEEETPDYIRYPFLVETKSRYREIVQFVDSLENSLGLNLDDLHIENDSKAPKWHRLKFAVSTFELTRTEFAPPDKPGKEQAGPPQIRDDIVVRRDPFLEKKLEQKGKKKVATASTRRKRPPRLELNAIFDIAGTRIAIVNEKIVKEGDVIAEHDILKIGDDRVLVGFPNKDKKDKTGSYTNKYEIKLKELVKTK